MVIWRIIIINKIIFLLKFCEWNIWDNWHYFIVNTVDLENLPHDKGVNLPHPYSASFGNEKIIDQCSEWKHVHCLYRLGGSPQMSIVTLVWLKFSLLKKDNAVILGQTDKNPALCKRV